MSARVLDAWFLLDGVLLVLATVAGYRRGRNAPHRALRAANDE